MMKHRWPRLLPLVVIIAEVSAVTSGRMSLGAAALVLVVVEVGVTGVALVIALRGARATAGSWLDRAEAGLSQVMPTLVARLVVSELRLFRSIALAVRHRLDTEHSDDLTIGYANGRATLPIIFLILAIGELVAVDLLVPWHSFARFSDLRWVALVLSAYGIAWMIAWVLAERTHPHLVTDAALVLRRGPWVVARIPWEHVERTESRVRYTCDDSRLTLDAPMCPTNLDLELRDEVMEHSALKRTARPRRSASLAVDDPEAAVKLIAARCSA